MSEAAALDVVIVGAGVTGALIASHLVEAGLRVQVLEAGPDTAQRYDDYAGHLRTFYAANAKGPESPWPAAKAASQPDMGDLRANTGYFVQRGPQPYGSTYTRRWGGSTLHWLGVSLRMLPEDFHMRSRHGVARDWPLGYDDLAPYYGKAEHTLGVSADVGDQSYHGLTFPEGYDYPMRRIPPSWSDQVLAEAVDGMTVEVGSERAALKVRSYPAARNGMPRGDYAPKGAVDLRPDGLSVDPHVGERCAGNTACTPICPIQARYHAGKTLAQAIRGGLEVLSQAVASKIVIDPADGTVQGIEYKRYDATDSTAFTPHVARARLYILAAHAVENAKLLLASGITGRGRVGKGLMDHPALYVWGLAPVRVGAFRGPLSTSGVEEFRGGAFRARQAAFRYDIGNDGWRATAGAPDTTVVDAVMRRGLYGKVLRDTLADTLARQVRFSLAVEQLPDPGNAVSVDPRFLDAIGNPRPVIDYHVDDYTRAGMAAALDVGRAVFRKAQIEDHSQSGEGAWFPSIAYRGQTFHYHGMGHFSGTHAMGDDPTNSVVDRDQRAWDHPNLFVAGAGSFVTMGTSNPTLTVAALSIRTAERVLATLQEA